MPLGRCALCGMRGILGNKPMLPDTFDGILTDQIEQQDLKVVEACLTCLTTPVGKHSENQDWVKGQ